MNVEYITGNEGSRRKPLLYVQAHAQTRDGKKVVAHFGDLTLWMAIDGQLQFSSSNQRTVADADLVLQQFSENTGVDQLDIVKGMLAAARHRATNRSTTKE